MLIGSSSCLLIVAVLLISIFVKVRRRRRRVSKSSEPELGSNSYDNIPATTPDVDGTQDVTSGSDNPSPAAVYANTAGDCGAQLLYQPLSMATRGDVVVYEELKKKNQSTAAAAADDDNGDDTRGDATNVYINGLSGEQSVYQSIATSAQNEPIYAALKKKKSVISWHKKK